ncbi:MAG: chemotaxis-specific protein-glutamate methyltransferase CheB [Leptospirales bacterium]|nr:chemotaxis-specific protein-glutamate methyltransferase CheB [Leptospirales bacterium]
MIAPTAVHPVGQQQGARKRVLIVDDSTLYRQALRSVISADPDYEVVSTAGNGKLALPRLRYYKPDFVILDQEMPELTGLELLDIIRRDYPSTRVLMFSAHTIEGSKTAIEALHRGAHDFIAKPEGLVAGAIQEFVDRKILQRLRALSPTTPAAASGRQQRTLRLDHEGPSLAGFRARAVCIAASTGGPIALRALLMALDRRLNGPIFLVQHMPPLFTRELALSLARFSGREIVEAEHGMAAQADVCYVAAGGKHMVVRDGADGLTIELNMAPPELSCRPSANILFRSLAASSVAKSCLAVVLTGMGEDGADGVGALVEVGGRCITQSEESCTVYGMPQAVDAAGWSSLSARPEDLGKKIVELMGGEP